MADQIIFTSAVRGIKPGASGYCTVLRSPGIRAALEQALEKLSVFEHTKCNRDRVTYSYRQIEIRDTTYYALSRISDTDKDYTGRTNFLAHHLVFQKEEMPDLSPADILLNWSGWCQQWRGEPREEPVDVQSLQQTPAINPPVRIWKEQAIGVDGAIKLASDTQSAFTLSSKECTDSSLLQLVAEVLAVRAKFNKSYKYTWTTTFSVGLAAVGSAKTFKWLALRDADDYALPKAGAMIDLDTTLPGGTTANEELSAIAREGEFRPAAKPIPLSSEKSTADRLSTPGNTRGAPQRGQRRRPAGKHEPRILKLSLGNLAKTGTSAPTTRKSKKKTSLYVIVSSISLLLFIIIVAFIFYVRYQEKAEARENYDRNISELIKQHEKYRDNQDIDPRYIAGIFDSMRMAAVGRAKTNEGIVKIEDNLVSSYDQIKREQAEDAIQVLWDFVQNESNLVSVKDEPSQSKDPNEIVESVPGNDLGGKSGNATGKPEIRPEEPHAVTNTESNSGNIEEDNSKAKAQGVAPGSISLDLNQYKKAVLLLSGEKLEIKERNHGGSKFKVTKGIERIEALSDDPSYIEYILELSGDYLVPASGNGGNRIPINSIISDKSESYAIQINPLSDKQELLVILGGNFAGTLKLGEIALEGCTAQKAFDTLSERFGTGSLELWIVADGYSTTVRTFDSSRSNGGNSLSNSTESQLLKVLSEQAGEADVDSDTMKQFNQWASAKIIEQIEGKKANAKENKSDNLEGRTESRKLAAAYEEIIKATQKSKTINGYFHARQKAIDELKEERDQSKDDAIKKGVRKAYSELFNGFSQLVIELPERRTYTFAWAKDEERWTLTFKGNVDNDRFDPSAKTEFDLNASLSDYIKLQGDAEENEKERAKAEQEQQAYNLSRVWERIEFRKPGEVNPIAIIEIK